MPWVSLTTPCVDAVISMVNSITKASASTMICGKATNLACIYLTSCQSQNTLLPIHRVHKLVSLNLACGVAERDQTPSSKTIPGSPSLLRVSKLPLLGLKLKHHHIEFQKDHHHNHIQTPDPELCPINSKGNKITASIRSLSVGFLSCRPPSSENPKS